LGAINPKFTGEGTNIIIPPRATLRKHSGTKEAFGKCFIQIVTMKKQRERKTKNQRNRDTELEAGRKTGVISSFFGPCSYLLSCPLWVRDRLDQPTPRIRKIN
jgi:hypothetical protein